jgi:Kef-type K+ transport system membrane component KefB
MNPMPLLLALLVLAYIGSLYASTERKRSFGTASGVEFVLLGVLLGPQALGVLGSEAVHAFDPLALMALGWIGLGYGVEWGNSQGRRAPIGRALLGCLSTCFIAACVGLSVYAVARALGWLSASQAELAAMAAALVSAETTRNAVSWVAERRGAQGPLSTFFEDLAAADDLPVMFGLAVVFARISGDVRAFGFQVEPWVSALSTLGIGALLGGVCAFLTVHDRSTVMGWGALLGCALLATGATTSLGLSAMGATFTMGLTLSLMSPIAAELRDKVVRTEPSLLLPALLLAGARLELPQGSQEIALVATALLARIGSAYASGWLLGVARRPFRPAARWLGVAMSASGNITMMVGLAFSLRLDGDVGRFALSAAALGTVLGELLGLYGLTRALDKVGELGAPPSKEPAEAPTVEASL